MTSILNKKKYITQKSSSSSASSSNKKSILIFCFVCYFGYFSATNRNKKKFGVALKIAKIFIFLFQMDITEKNFVSVSKYNLEYLREIQMNLLKNLTKLMQFNFCLFPTPESLPFYFISPYLCLLKK